MNTFKWWDSLFFHVKSVIENGWIEPTDNLFSNPANVIITVPCIPVNGVARNSVCGQAGDGRDECKAAGL